jgi:hypothetical protein
VLVKAAPQFTTGPSQPTSGREPQHGVGVARLIFPFQPGITGERISNLGRSTAFSAMVEDVATFFVSATPRQTRDPVPFCGCLPAKIRLSRKRIMTMRSTARERSAPESNRGVDGLHVSTEGEVWLTLRRRWPDGTMHLRFPVGVAPRAAWLGGGRRAAYGSRGLACGTLSQSRHGREPRRAIRSAA